MPIDPKSLQSLSRDQLIAKARELGAKRPELLTRPELRDEILRLLAIDEVERQRARGWFGVARDLVASVVSQGLNLPDTAELIRGSNVFATKAAPPVATVTLAEIYAAQGHLKKALDLLDEVIEKEPDHEAARQARDRWSKLAGNGASAAVAARSSVLQSEEEDGPAVGEDSSSGPVDSHASAIEIGRNVAAERAEQTRQIEEESARLEAERAEQARQGAEQARLAEQRASLEVARLELARTEAKRVTEDRVLLVRQSERLWLCAWQFSRKTLNRVSAEESDGVLNLRLIEVQPSWDGPVTVQKNVQLPAPKGHITIELERPEPEIRVAIGWLAGDRFTVLGLGTEFDWDRDRGAHLIWSPPAMGRGEVWQAANAAAVTELMKSVAISVAS